MFSKGVRATKNEFEWSELQALLDMAIGYYAYTKEIEFIYPRENFSINGDIDLLDMLFSNFIMNAIDAIEASEEERGVVKITHKSDADHHLFYIYDSGVAIENKEELFKAFKSTKLKGNGLGLVLSRQIAESHNGTVALLDTTEKCFEITIAK